MLGSSATVYGPQPQQPVRETAWPHPQAPYAVSKLAAEHYVFALGALNGIETVALRIFNAYGPGQRIPPVHAPVVPHFARNVLNRSSVIVHGNGQQTRDFVYIDDVVDALIAAATAADVDRKVINIGSGQETSIHTLIATLGQVTQRQPEVIYNPQEGGGISRLVADLSVAQRLLGYRVKVPLTEGLERLLAEDPALPATAPVHSHRHGDEGANRIHE